MQEAQLFIEASHACVERMDKAKAAQANLRADYEKQLAAFHQQRDQALEQMRKVQASSSEACTDLMRGTDDAWAKMREAVEKARSQFKK